MGWYRKLQPEIKKDVYNHIKTKLSDEVGRAGTIAEYTYVRAAFQRGVISAVVTAAVMTFFTILLAGATMGAALLLPVIGAVVAFVLVVGTACINYSHRIEAGVKGQFDLLVKNQEGTVKEVETKNKTKEFQEKLSNTRDYKSFVEEIYPYRGRLSLGM